MRDASPLFLDTPHKKMNSQNILPFDRWVEMDLQWFRPGALDQQIPELVQRLKPLYASISGKRGLIFNVGWLIDLATEWQGSDAQPLPLHSRRTAGWSGATYADLRDFFNRLRGEALRQRVADFKIGVLFVEWGHVVWPPDIKIYDFDSDWYDRHPEVYDPPRSFIGMPELRPGARLLGDHYPYATAPQGIPDGLPFIDFFAAQWGAVSKFLGLDALVLRDGFMGPMIYTRHGPYGMHASPDPGDAVRWTEDVRRLFRQVKAANPHIFLMGYSSGISAVADWRVGCVDFESVIADGALDAWIDQTWGGAWQDWWSQEWKGWTFQLAYLLLHRVMIEAANRRREIPCRHYHLIETWDAWEPWDTLHQVPGKLRWAMWAFSHAAVLKEDRKIGVPHGSYLSWANRRDGELLSQADVAFIQENLDAAQRSAASLEHAFGPYAVYNRESMQWLADTHPDWNASEWLDEQIGFLIKWGLPLLGATRLEWIDSSVPQGLVLGLPGKMSAERRGQVGTLIRGQPALIIGRADLIEPEVLEIAGLETCGELRPKGFVSGRPHGDLAYDLPDFNILHLPEHQPVRNVSAEVLFECETGPALTRKGQLLYWQPPDWSEPSNQFLPRYQVGSLAAHALAARAFARQISSLGFTHLEAVPFAQPLAFHYWRSDQQTYFLFGNLETGLTGDARLGRAVRLIVSLDELQLPEGAYRLRSLGGEMVEAKNQGDRLLRFDITLGPEDSLVFTLEKIT
jgi:hypothetical protein